MIKIYTDGSCTPNPGRGGWAYIIVYGDGSTKEESGSIERTTNNQMELLAAINALAECPPGEYEVISDSQYLIGTMTHGWAMRENERFWIILQNLIKDRKITWTKCKGHSSSLYNSLVDKLARVASTKLND